MLELLGVLPLLLELPEELLLELPELPWFKLFVEEELELPLWLEFPLEVPPWPEVLLPLLLGVWLDELPLLLFVSELEDAEPEPEREPLPLTLEPWLPDELGRLVLELEELSGVVIRGLLAEELPDEVSLELELPAPPLSAWLQPSTSAAAAATGIMNRFII